MVKYEPNEMKPHKAHTRQRLFDAITSGRLYQTKCLLEIDGDVNFVDEEGNSPLHRAAMIEDEKDRTRREMLKLLIKSGADVNLPDSQERHILSWACINNKEDIVHLLFRYSIHDLDLNMVDLHGNTALMYAVRSQNLNIVQKLVQGIVRFGLDIDLRNDEDCTAYLEARRLGFQECANILVEDGHASKDILINPFLGGHEIKSEGDSGESRKEDNPRRKVSPRLNRILVNPDMKRKHKITPDFSRTRETTLKRASARPKSSGSPRKLLVRRHGNENDLILSQESSSQAMNSSREGQEYNTQDTRSKSVDMTNQDIGLIMCNDTQMNHGTTFTSNKKGLSASGSYSKGTFRNFTQSQSRKPIIQKRAMTASVGNKRDLKQLNSHTVLDRSKSHDKELYLSKSLQRSRTMPASARSSCSDISSISDTSSEMSWYSHFSRGDSPRGFLSLSNMQALMQLYAVQASDTSSFRVGLPVPKSLPPEMHGDDDKHSEGGKSEDTPHSGLSSNTKRFAIVTRTVASYLQQKRNLTTIKVKDRIPGM